MVSFRLYSARIDENNIYADNVTLISPQHKFKENDHSNYFSLIIGNNGTGKSRVLCSIAKLFKRVCDEKYSSKLFSSEASFSTPPNKIIALTNSLSDRFPLDNSFKKYVSVYERYNKKDNFIKNIYRDSRYIYLGPRSRNHFFSNKTSINRALDILFEYYSETEVSGYYRHVFDYLDFEPILKLQYRIPGLLKKGKHITKEFFFENAYGKPSSVSDRIREIDPTTSRLIDLYGEELADFLNHTEFTPEGYREILINFSAKNIERYSYDKSQYYGNTHEYRMLNILRKLNIVRSYEVKVYKKGGSEFGFGEASSGEANILSTLLALIPLLGDNCLVLIDEPEISLHPIWQAKYMELLTSIFDHFHGCHIVIASHSHLLVTDLPPERSTVITLQNRKKNIVSKIVDKPTFGWSAEDILLNVFGLPTSRNYYLSQILSKGLELLADHNRKKSELDSVKQQIKEYFPLMKDNDPLKSIASIILNEKV